MKTTNLDWDDITLKEAQKRASDIESIEGASTTLYKTRHGFHCVLSFNREISINENFQLRNKWFDDRNRIAISKLRYQTLGYGFDVLFNCKNGHWRKQI